MVRRLIEPTDPWVGELCAVELSKCMLCGCSCYSTRREPLAFSDFCEKKRAAAAGLDETTYYLWGSLMQVCTVYVLYVLSYKYACAC